MIETLSSSCRIEVLPTDTSRITWLFRARPAPHSAAKATQDSTRTTLVSMEPMATDTNGVVDITILGAGPSGLAAAYYAGHRDGSVRIIESLEQLGGQVAAVYPEKHVYDVAGHPKILGQNLVELCAEQGLQYGPEVHLGEEIQTLERISENGEELLAVSTNKGGPYLSRALIITAGHGAFEPRKLGVDDIDVWEGRGLHYFVREKDVFRDRTCVIVGGGDSALDWTLGLQDTARAPIALVHRRDNFRALESSVSEARKLESEGKVRIFTPSEVREIHGDGSIEAVTIENMKSGESEQVACDALITLLGFHSHLGAIAEWGLELEGKRQIRIDPTTCETNLPRVFAAGDVAGYPGKITLITIGMGEAAIAANNAIAQLRGEKTQPKYSTD
jgi:ferredoxin/flavodoxin---NADP+ reductase